MLPSGGRSTGHGGHRYGRSVQSRPVPASAACTSYPSPLPKTWLRLGGLVTRTLPHWRLLSLPTAHRHAPNTIVKRVAVQRKSWRIERASLWSTITARMRTMVRLSTFLLASACCGKADGVPSSGETGHSTLEGGMGESDSSGGTDTAAAPRDASAGGDSAGSPLDCNVTQVSVGGNATCALLRDGTAKCWGYNAAGELGIAPGTPWSSTPVVVKDRPTPCRSAQAFGTRAPCSATGQPSAGVGTTWVSWATARRRTPRRPWWRWVFRELRQLRRAMAIPSTSRRWNRLGMGWGRTTARRWRSREWTLPRRSTGTFQCRRDCRWRRVFMCGSPQRDGPVLGL